MNAKVLASMMVTVMLCVSFSCIAMQEDSAADYSKLELPTINFTDKGESDFTLNEGEYHGYKYTLNFYAVETASLTDTTKMSGAITPGNVDTDAGWVKIGTTNNVMSGADYVSTYTKAFDGGVAINDSKFKFNLECMGVGRYNIIITDANSDSTNNNFFFALMAEMIVTVGLVEKTLNYQLYVADVKIGAAQSNTVLFNNIDDVFVAGVYGHERIAQPTGATVLGSLDQYYFYATGLPAGLSMSDSGIISGTPRSENLTGTEVTISAINKTDGKTYHGTLVIKVGRAQTDTVGYDYKVTGDDTKNPQYVVAYQNALLEVNTIKKDSTDPVNMTKVSVMGSDGTYKEEYPNSDKVTLNTSGTGCYSVTIKCEGYLEYTFLVYVLPSFGDVNASIVAGSS